MIKQLHNKYIVYVKLVDTNVQIGINTSVTSVIVISNKLNSKKFKRYCFIGFTPFLFGIPFKPFD